MHIVTGRDALELRREVDGIPSHTLKVLDLDRDDGSAPLTPEQLRAHVAGRLAQVGGLEPLRWRLAPIGRGRLLPPSWVVTDPDLDEHLGRIVLGTAGAPSSLDELLGRLLEAPLDRGRPLWQLHLVEDGSDRQVLVLAVHHALGGGQECATVLEALFGPDHPGAPPRPPDPPPSLGALLVGAARREASLARRVPSLLSTVRAERRREPDQGPATVRPFDSPRSRWSWGVAGIRRVGSTTLSLPEVVRVGRLRGATVNEVLLTLVGAALADLQERHGDPLDRSLTAAVPVDRGRPGATSGNDATTTAIDLGGRLPDPVARLDLVAASSRAAKVRHLGASPLPYFAFTELGSLHANGVRVGVVVGQRLVRRPSFSTVVSLVRAPAGPLAVHDLPIGAITSYGLLAADIGCNVTAWSRGDRLEVGVTGCAALDAADLADRLASGLVELAAAVDAAVLDRPDTASASSAEVPHG